MASLFLKPYNTDYPADTKKHLNLSIKMYQYQDPETVSQQDVLKKNIFDFIRQTFNSLKQELDNLYENNDIFSVKNLIFCIIKSLVEIAEYILDTRLFIKNNYLEHSLTRNS